MKKHTTLHTILLMVFLGIPFSTYTYSDAQAQQKVPLKQTQPAEPERVDVDKIKEKYWAKGDESELGVVQNRLYTKAKKFEVALFTGVIFSDPFLTVSPLGLSFGYNFSESFATHLMYMRTFASGSTANDTLEASGKTANTNLPNNYMGGEGTFSFIYGKLSLLGASILYYDMSLSAGAGVMSTESGSYFAPHLGIGQRFFINKNFSFKIDYRMMFYRENILEKEITALIGQSTGFRNNFSNTITFGIDFMFGGGGDPK